MTKKQSDKQSLLELMPQDGRSQHILSERAKHLAMPLSTSETQQDIEYVRFKLGEELYGISYEYIKEVIMYTTPTKVPYTTTSIAGVINRHGALISVLDLTNYFHLKTDNDIRKGFHFIVVFCQGLTIAILVHALEGNDGFNLAELNPPLQLKGAIKPNYIQGLHGGTTAIINVEALFSDLQNRMHIKES